MSQYPNQGQQPNQLPSDEIDLRDVFAAIGRFFSSIGRGIVNLILAIRRATRRFSFLILGFLLAGAVAGFILSWQSKDYFRAQMVIDSRFYSYELLASIVGNLNEQAEEEDVHALSKELNIPEAQAAKLRGITVEPIMPIEEKTNMLFYIRMIQENLETLEEEQIDSLRARLMQNASQYVLTAEVYDNAVLDDLQAGLMTYLSSKEYVARRAKVERGNLEMLKRSIEEDEQKLDKLKGLLAENGRYSEGGMSSGSNTIFLGASGEQPGAKNVFEQSIALYTRKARINQRLMLNKAVEVVNDFTPIQKPASFSLASNLLIWSLLGVGLAYLIILLIGINKALNRYEQKRQRTGS